MLHRIIGIVICCTVIISPAAAQGLSVELDGGLQGIHYQLPAGADKLLPGGSLALLYTFRLKGPLDLVTGITGGVYRTQATLPDGVVFTNYQVDDEGSAFQYNAKAEGYKETQRFFAAGIPVLLQYHTTGKGRQWYVSAGGKVLLPSSASIAISARQLILSGYYPDYNIDVSNLPQHGFGAINNWKASTSAVMKPSAALSAAAGLSFPLPRGMRLYTGLYVDYGLTPLKSGRDSTPLVTYNPAGVSGVQAGSVLNMPNTGQAKLFSFGVQLRLSLASIKPRTAAPHATPHKAKQEPAAVPLAPMDSTIGDDDTAFIQKPIVFGAIDETAVPEEGQEHLDEVAAILMQHPKLRISLVGHICNSGTDTEDPKVGLARAKAVEGYLQAKGIDKKRLDVGAVDQSDPITPNNPAANYQKRRVVIRVVPAR